MNPPYLFRVFSLTAWRRHPLAPFVLLLLLALAGLSLSRLGLALWQSERVESVDGWWPVLLQGVRIDVSTLCYLLFVPAAISLCVSGPAWLMRGWTQVARVWLVLVAVGLLYMELATPSFINEYNLRPNRLFIEYLIYPREVFGMLIKSHGPQLVIGLLICCGSALWLWRQIGCWQAQVTPLRWQWRPAAVVLLALVMLLGGRSSLGHRPLNPAAVYFSTDPLVNSLVLNSSYSTAFAAKQLLAEESGKSRYGELEETEVIDAVRQWKGLAGQAPLDPAIPTLAPQTASYRGKPKNLVIVLEESLGARFVGALGGLPLTPNLDRLAEKGWFFERMLATGTRSVRGIEAVVTGFTPTPDRAVVKLDKSQQDFFTLAELLSRQGYATEFIYGGEAHFDNMKSFFLGNGFERITERKDYQSPKFVGSWGVSDEDLFDKAHERLTALHQDSAPFFSLVFSSSNHTPFDYPDGRIIPHEQPANTRNNAIKYADWSLGHFFELALQSDYWRDTVFLVVADHDARVMGADLVPPKSFHIPALLLGQGIEPRRDGRILSQLDLAPTLLSLIGVDNVNPMLGRDLTRLPASAPGRGDDAVWPKFCLA